jgi:hypothetical protein
VVVFELETFEVTLANRNFDVIGGGFTEMSKHSCPLVPIPFRAANAMFTNRVNSLETDRMMWKTT